MFYGCPFIYPSTVVKLKQNFSTYSGFGKWAFKSNLEQISSQSGKHLSLIRDTWPIMFGHDSVMKSLSGRATSFEMKCNCERTANDTTSNCKKDKLDFSIFSFHFENMFYVPTVVGSSPKKNGLSAKMSDSTLMSRFPNSSISSGLCTPMPCALTFFIPWNHWIWDNHQQNKHTHTNV